MADDAPSRLSAATGRRFAVTLAAGFGALGVVAYARAHGDAAIAFASVSAALLALGMFVPTRLGPLQRAWMAFGVALSRLTSPVFYAVIYWLVLTPTGILRRTLGRSPLVRDPAAASFWVPRARVDDAQARRRMERQF